MRWRRGAVGNLPKDAQESELTEMFSRVGNVVNTRCERQRGRSVIFLPLPAVPDATPAVAAS